MKTKNSEEKSQFRVNGEDLVKKLKDIVKEGNIRKIIIKNEKEETLIEIPLTVGVVGALLIPVWAAVGVIAAMVTKCTIIVEKAETPKAPSK